VLTRVLIGLFGLVVVAALVAGIVGLVAPSNPVYGVAEIQAALRQQPRAWTSRTVRVRGWINGGGGEQCFGPPTATCAGKWITLTADGRWGVGAQLNVVLPEGLREDSLWPRPGGAIVFLWHLPIVGRAIRERSLSSTLRVRLLVASPACDHAPGPCAAGVLVP